MRSAKAVPRNPPAHVYHKSLARRVALSTLGRREEGQNEG